MNVASSVWQRVSWETQISDVLTQRWMKSWEKWILGEHCSLLLV